MMTISPRFLEDIINLEESGLLNGCFHTISDDVYHDKRCPGVSSSTLKDYLNYSPRKAKWIEDHRTQTDAMIMGSAVHLLTFQPKEFASQFAIVPEGVRRDIRTKDYQAFLADLGGRKAMTAKDYELAKAYSEAVCSHPKVKQILEIGMFERTVFWNDPDTGILLKCKPDCVTPDGILFDLKTTTSANPYIWGANAIKLGYDLSAAMYIDGCNAAGMGANTMYFIALEKSAPYEIAIRHFDSYCIDMGRQKYKHALKILKECRENGVFPAYPDESETVIIPTWASNWSPERSMTFEENGEQ